MLKIKKYNKWVWINRIFLFVVMLGFFVAAGWSYFAFSGEKTYTTTFEGDTYGITMLSPQERLTEDGAVLIAEPLYFKVRAPLGFESAEVTMVYDAVNQAVIDLGVVANESRGISELKTIQNKHLETLLKNNDYRDAFEVDLDILAKEYLKLNPFNIRI